MNTMRLIAALAQIQLYIFDRKGIEGQVTGIRFKGESMYIFSYQVNGLSNWYDIDLTALSYP